MAIFHFSSNVVRRAGTSLARQAHHTGTRVSHGAGGRHAYLAATKHIGADGLETDYRGKNVLDHSFHLPDGVRRRNANEVWRDVDNHKVKQSKTGKVYRPVVALDVVGALPHELSSEQNIAAARAYGKLISNHYGVPVTVGVHPPDNDRRNVHAHFLIGVRRMEPDGTLGTINQKLNVMHSQPDERLGRERGEVPVQTMRRLWEETINDHLAMAGCEERIDRRSAAERGIEAKPYIPVDEYRKMKIEERLVAAAKLAANTRAIDEAQIKQHLQRISERAGAEAARKRETIDAIKRGRYEEIDPKVRFALSSVHAYDRDAFGTFFRDMERQNRLARRKPKKERREYTPEERAEMRRIGLAMKRDESRMKSAQRLLAVSDLGSLMIAAPKRSDYGWLRTVRKAVSVKRKQR